MSSDDDSDFDNVGGADAKAIEQYMSEQEREEGEVDDWVEEIMLDMGKKEDTGPAINDNLARLINQLLSGRTAEEKCKDIMKKHVRPDNVNMLVNSRVNPQIWSRLKENTKKSDLRLAHASDKLVKYLTTETNIIVRLSLLKDNVMGHTRKKV